MVSPLALRVGTKTQPRHGQGQEKVGKGKLRGGGRGHNRHGPPARAQSTSGTGGKKKKVPPRSHRSSIIDEMNLLLRFHKFTLHSTTNVGVLHGYG